MRSGRCCSHVVLTLTAAALGGTRTKGLVVSSKRVPWTSNPTIAPCTLLKAFADNTIDFQSDTNLYGRGDHHLSASLQEGDIVVYQTGSWLVDGVQVGDGSEIGFEYAKVETIQLVWTHNCEHGVVRGVAVQVKDSSHLPTLSVVDPLEDVEFGPEQLIARIPVNWDTELKHQGRSMVPFDESLWKAHAYL